jgi:peptidoglycan/LPS O-acetylase OafA/YrhL
MKLEYRPEIDGLRAIAIILIILSHFKNLGVASGGVNIFFIISGYLISHIFISQKLDVFKFYKIRFLKLYPQIFIIGSLTFLLFLIIGDLDLFNLIIRSYISNLIGLFNFYLIKVGNVYGQENTINPFLPFWAFCVIVQFYLIYPFVLKIIFYIKKKYKFTDDFITVSLLFISIFLFSFYFYYRDSVLFNFYSPLSRYWQFLLGSFIYFLIKSGRKLCLNNLTIYLAVILIFIWQLNFDRFYDWRKVQVLLTISSLLFLYSTKFNIFNQILSIRPLVYLGKISYPLYLIHLPIIYFISLWFDSGVVIISLTSLVLITYFYNNFICSNLYKQILNLFFLNRIFYLFLLSVLIFSSSIYLFNKNLVLQKEREFINFVSKINYINYLSVNFNSTFGNSHESSIFLLKGRDNKDCYNRNINDNYLENCSFITSENNRNFFLIGGSEISSLSYDLKKRLKNYNYYHLNSQLYVPDFNRININDQKEDLDFINTNNFIKNLILSIDKESIILIGARYTLYLNKSYSDKLKSIIGISDDYQFYFKHIKNSNLTWENHFKDSIKELLKNNKYKVILVYPFPEMGFNAKTKILNYKFFNDKIYDVSYQAFIDRTKSSFKLLDSIEGDNIYRVYPHKLFCNTFTKNRCVNHYDNSIFYSDDTHPSIKGAELINELVIEQIKIIESKSN